MAATFGQHLRVVSQKEALLLPCLGGLLHLGNTAVHRRQPPTINQINEFESSNSVKAAGFGWFNKLQVYELILYSCQK